MNMVNQIVCYRGDRSASGSANKAAAFNGGLLMTRDANADTGTAPTGTFAAKTWSTGARSGGTAPCAINLKTFVIYETAVSDANIERISRLLG
jgi:hypothetical protein